jgi:hypothetical protein
VWDYYSEDWENNVRNDRWLQLLHPFIAVKNVYITENIVPLIALALRELVGERVTEALPALECLFLDGLLASGPVRDAIGPFVAARQLSTHPVVASYWDFDDRSDVSDVSDDSDDNNSDDNNSDNNNSDNNNSDDNDDDDNDDGD